MQRGSETVRATKNIDIGLEAGNTLLVQLTGSSFTGTVDFQSSMDGANFDNTPYVSKDSITAVKSVSQISNPSTRTVYIVLAPQAQVRIAVAVTSGSLEVYYREVDTSIPTNLIGHDTTGLGHGVKTVTTVGTDEVLAASTACKWVIIQAQTDNTDKVAVGASGVDATVATGNGTILDPGDAVTLLTDNLADIYVDALVAGEGVRYLYGS